MNLEVTVALEVVGEKANAQFQRHQCGRGGQFLDLGRGQKAFARLEITPGHGFKQAEVKPDPLHVGFVLVGQVAARANHVAEVEVDQPGHHRVQIDHAKRLTAMFVKQ